MAVVNAELSRPAELSSGPPELPGLIAVSVWMTYVTGEARSTGETTMKKPMATSIPACIDPPVSPLPFVRDDPEALEEWIAFRLELDGLEASLQAEHPGYNWKQAMRPHKAEAAALRRGGR